MTDWKCCKKDPSETGKKVLCHRKGDIYVAMRVMQYYLPMPFCDHYFCDDLCFPETWSEIDFPPGLTGHLRVVMPDNSNIISLSEMEVDYPHEFHEFASTMIKSIASLEKPSKNQTK